MNATGSHALADTRDDLRGIHVPAKGKGAT